VSQLKASVLSQPSVMLALEHKPALEEAKVATTAAAAALHAAFDSAEKFLAVVGPARLRRTKQLLEDRASAVRNLLEQAEKVQSEVCLSLKAAEALFARLQIFRAAEVRNECTAHVDWTRQHSSRLFSFVVLKLN
jgi:hypothetical protein